MVANHQQDTTSAFSATEGDQFVFATSLNSPTPSGPAHQAPPKRKSGKKVALITVAIFVVLLAAAYAVGVYFFSSHFFPSTALGNTDVSLKSSDVLAEAIQEQVETYELTIAGDTFSYTFEASDASIDLDATEIASGAVANQNEWAWPVEVFCVHDISDIMEVTYDTESVTEVLTDALKEYNADQTKAEDASLVFNEDTDAFEIEEEVYGTQFSTDAVLEKVDEAILVLDSEVELTDSDYILPSVFAIDPSVQEVASAAEEQFPNDVTLTMADSVELATVTRSTIASWTSINAEDYSIELDEDAISEWADENVKSIDTVGTERTWTRADGKECTTSGGTFGWTVDTSSVGSTIYDALSEGGASTIEVECSQEGDVYTGSGERDWGAYIDVDFTEQHVRYYDENDELVYECDCVTGNLAKGYDTPTGAFSIINKAKAITLKGDGYESYVDYWLAFYGSGYGLHDASWRSTFGGTIYKTNGSHGCVNLPTSAAKWFYENVPSGTAVITHY